MELGDWIGLGIDLVRIITTGVVLVLGGRFVLTVILPAEEKKKQLQIWPRLAKTHNLTIQPGILREITPLEGYYKGYRLKLETRYESRRWNRIAYTQARLSRLEPQDGLKVQSEDVSNDPLTENEIIRLFQPTDLVYSNEERIQATPQGRQIIYEKDGFVADDIRLVQMLDWLVQIATAYPAIVALGSEAVLCLQNIAESHKMVHPIALQLLRDISQETTERLQEHADHLFCALCLTHCTKYEVDIQGWQSIGYYGCRSCGQSREFLGGILAVAVLDNGTGIQISQQHGALYVNWSLRQELFDFSEVKIIRATDEEVERFVVQVGNDTDPLRQDRYKQLNCLVSHGCPLSNNSMRILERTFDQVIIQ